MKRQIIVRVGRRFNDGHSQSLRCQAGRKDQKSAREITSNQRRQRGPLQEINKKIIEDRVKRKGDGEKWWLMERGGRKWKRER